MRIVAFFSAISVTILLLAGCGHEKSKNSQVVNFVQLGGVEYPESPNWLLLSRDRMSYDIRMIPTEETYTLDARQKIIR